MRSLMKNFSIVAAGVTLATVSATAIAGDTTTVKLGNNSQYDAYLVDGAGNSLYLFEADKSGQSTCYDACAQKWPAVTTTGEVNAGDEIDARKLDTTKRKDGKTQVTYDGHPLYRYVKDQEPGEANGQDIEDAGAEWYLLHANGAKVGHENEN